MDHFTTRRAQGSVDDDFEALPLFLKEPCIHHTPAAHQTNAVVLQKIARLRWYPMLFEVGWRRADNAFGRENLLGDHTGIRGEANAERHIEAVIDDIQAGIG